MRNKLNIAVIGCGYWGPNLIRNLLSLSGECHVAMICDKSRDRLEHMKSVYPQVETTADVETIMNNPAIDAVVIATPVGTHYALARMALMNNKHVMVEKPLAVSSQACRELIRVAEERRLTLMVGHTFIYSAPVRFMQKLVRSGELGEIYCINSRRLNLGLFQSDINVAWDLAPHDISIILSLLDQMPESVNCQGRCHLNGQEDVTNISMNFANGPFATIQSSWLDPNKIREMIIVGSRRMVVYDDMEPNEKIKIFDKCVEKPPHYDSFADFQFSYHYGDMIAPFIQQTEPLRVEVQHFIDCIHTGNTPESSGQKGMDVVRILEAASLSLEQGGGKIVMNNEAVATPPAQLAKSESIVA